MKTFKQFQEDYTRVINPVKPVTDLIGAGLGAYELGKKAFSGLSNIFQAKKKNYGINLRVNRKAKKDDYYDGGEAKEKRGSSTSELATRFLYLLTYGVPNLHSTS